MKNSRKKGFTIVELVIVIAVIGILAAVLIPTFVKLIRKSKINNDTQLIRTLNEALAADRVDNEHNTMTNVLRAAQDYGYVVANINAKASGNEILWDSKNDAFVYLNDGTVEYLPDLVDDKDKLSAGDYRLWKIYNGAVPADNKYSIYLASQAAADSINNVNINVGVDCGNYVVENIKYKNTGDARNVVINTNSEESNLTIDDQTTGTIYHYGKMGALNIIQCHSASFHEKGKVAFVEISKGRIVLETGAEVNHIHVNAMVDSSNNKLDEFDEIIIAKATAVEMPNLSRDDVNINETTGTLVVALQNGTSTTSDTDFVWLTKQGIYEQIKVSDSASSAGTVWANDDSNSAETQTAAQQIANNIGRNNDGTIASVTVETVEYEIAVDPTTRELVITNKDTGDAAEAAVVTEVKETAVESAPAVEDVKTGATLFAGGSGSKSDPFLIYDYETMQHITDLYDKGYYYFAVAMEKTNNGKIDLKDGEYVELNGSFDGKGVEFVNVNAGIFGDVGSISAIDKEVTLKNFSVSFNGGFGIVQVCATQNLLFSNISVSGYLLEDWNAGVFLRYGSASAVSGGFDYSVNFEKCSSRAEVYSSTNAYSAILIGHGYQGANNTVTINVDSETNNSIESTILYYTGTATTAFGYKYYCMTSGTTIVNINGVEQYNGPWGSYTANKMTGSNVVKILSNKNPSKAGDGRYQITPESDTTKIVVTLNWQYTEWENNYSSKITNLNGVGGNIGDKIVLDINGTDAVTLFNHITSIEIKTGQSEWGYELSNGKLTLNMTTSNTFIDGNLTLIVEQFTSGSSIAKYKGSLGIASKTTDAEWVIK